MKKILLLLTIIYFQACTTANTAELNWRNYNDGLEKAKKENKLVIIDFYADWCGWCKKMDVDLFQNKEIVKIIQKNFITIRVDVESSEKLTIQGHEISPKQLSNAYKVTGLPTLIFANHEGKIITPIPGYIPPKTFKPLLKYFVKKLYLKNISLKDYMNQNKEK